MAKRIIGFTMKEFAIKMWLPQCNYPNDVTEKGIHNAMLQGPAPLKKNVKTVPLVSTYFSGLLRGQPLDCFEKYHKRHHIKFKYISSVNPLRAKHVSRDYFIYLSNHS